MYDIELIKTLKSSRRVRVRILLITLVLFFAVLLCPLLFQNAFNKFTHSYQVMFCLVWLVVLSYIAIYGGFWKQIKAKRSISWACLQCGKCLNFEQIRSMVQLGKCPSCGEIFNNK